MYFVLARLGYPSWTKLELCLPLKTTQQFIFPPLVFTKIITQISLVSLFNFQVLSIQSEKTQVANSNTSNTFNNKVDLY